MADGLVGNMSYVMIIDLQYNRMDLTLQVRAALGPVIFDVGCPNRGSVRCVL